MPSYFDSRPVTVTHDPVQRLDTAPGKLQLPNPIDIIKQLIDLIVDNIDQIPGLNLIPGLQEALQIILDALDGIDLLNPGSILAAITEAVTKLITVILGVLTGSVTGAGDLGALGFLLAVPLQLVQGLMSAVAQLQQQVAAGLAGLHGRIDAVVDSIASGATTVVYDNFNRPAIGSGWTNTVGTLAIFQGPFDGGYIQTNGISAGYYNTGFPDSDKQGALIKIVNKQAGLCRIAICSNTAMTNYAALEIRAGYFGFDYVRIVTGSSPTLVVGTGKQWNGAIDNGWVFDIRYDPATNEFIVLKNKDELLRWEDTANVITHGSSNRRQAIVSNGENNTNFLFPEFGFAITDYTGYKW